MNPTSKVAVVRTRYSGQGPKTWVVLPVKRETDKRIYVTDEKANHLGRATYYAKDKEVVGRFDTTADAETFARAAQALWESHDPEIRRTIAEVEAARLASRTAIDARASALAAFIKDATP